MRDQDTTTTIVRSIGDQCGAISKLVVHAIADYTGRGPTSVQTSIGNNVVTVVLSDNLTKAETSLVRGGSAELVIATRRAFQRTMAPVLIAGVERITGRQVHAFLSDNHVDPDVAVETFVLRPIGSQPDPPLNGEPDRRAPMRGPTDR